MSTRLELLKVLEGRSGQILSGEVLARRLGISRTGVWKQLQSMKNVGLPLEGTGRRGYRLKAPFDNSLALLHSTSWATPHYYLNASSTQVLAKGGATSGLPEGHFWVAETQSKGRGRLDRRWESAYGGLWFSLLLRPKVPAASVPPLTLLAGLSLRNAVEEITGVCGKLKWPNDLVVNSRKLAGILTEMSGQMDRTEWVLLGVGLNVNNTLPRHLSHQAVSLSHLTGCPWPRAQILNTFLRHFHRDYARFLKEGFEPFKKSYWGHYFSPNKLTRLKTAQGPMTGIARGVDASGAIMIESRRKIHLISEGEIVL